MQYFSILASLCSWTDYVEQFLVWNPEDSFSQDDAYYKMLSVLG